MEVLTAAGRFQLTPPHGGRLETLRNTAVNAMFQLTPPHGGRLVYPLPRGPGYVSTHAPARGATSTWISLSRLALVSTHAPARGATELQVRGPHHRSFNSRPRTGGDQAAVQPCGHPVPVSTHAPARGATTVAAPNAPCTYCFNSRPRTGGDKGIWAFLHVHGFQLTPPHGGRQRAAERASAAAQFQLTPPHGGRRCAVIVDFAPGAVSTHAPARGATSYPRF